MSLKSSKVRNYMAGHLVTFKPNDDVMDAIHTRSSSIEFQVHRLWTTRVTWSACCRNSTA